MNDSRHFISELEDTLLSPASCDSLDTSSIALECSCCESSPFLQEIIRYVDDSVYYPNFENSSTEDTDLTEQSMTSLPDESLTSLPDGSLTSSVSEWEVGSLSSRATERGLQECSDSWMTSDQSTLYVQEPDVSQDPPAEPVGPGGDDVGHRISSSECDSFATAVEMSAGDSSGATSILRNDVSITPSILALSPVELRDRLDAVGARPGPVTASTHRLYQKQLSRIRRHGNPPAPPSPADVAGDHSEAISAVLGWSNSELQALAPLERQFCADFAQTASYRGVPNRRTCFNYLLLDPSLTADIDGRVADGAALAKFADAVFYVGKGQQQRSYCHLLEALEQGATVSNKVRQIRDIWRGGRGVVPVHLFHHRSAEEALVREALLIETLHVDRLTNVLRGSCSRLGAGAGPRWTPGQRRRLGVYLLFKALCLYLLEGETQLRPEDLPRATCRSAQ